MSATVGVIGVGGAGGRVVSQAAPHVAGGAHVAAINTDARELDLAAVPVKLQIGAGRTGGLGAGYMNGGFEDLSNTPGSGFKTAPPASMLNGWGWTWTAAARCEAELAAFAVTHDAEHGVRATRAFEWFLGRNHLERPLYNFATGGCSDGLGIEALNQNEGAESTLVFHRAALVLDAAPSYAASGGLAGDTARAQDGRALRDP